MRNSKLAGVSPWRFIFIAWLVFATLYVVYNEYNRLNNYVAQRAYNAGVTNSVMQLMEQAKTCQPIPVKANGTETTFISVDCLTQKVEEAAE